MKDDTISRTAAIDAVNDVDWYHQNQHGEMVHGANPDEHQAWYKADDIYAAIDSAPSAQPVEDVRAMCGECDAWNQYKNPQTGWIPTSVKPPEPFKLVLIQDYCGCYELNTYIPPRINPKQYQNGYWGEVGNVDFDYFDVEAWCPLPAPYCPEGEEHEQSD